MSETSDAPRPPVENLVGLKVDVAAFLLAFCFFNFLFWLGGVDLTRGVQQAVCLMISFVSASLVALVVVIFRSEFKQPNMELRGATDD